MCVSLGGQSLAILNRNTRYTRLNLRPRGGDKVHNPESFYKGIGVMGRRPGPGLNPPRGNVAQTTRFKGRGTLAPLRRGGGQIETFGNVSKYRHRIEHLSIIRPDQIAMARELGVVGVVQPRFILSDWRVVNRVGLSRVNWVYPLKTLYQNLHLAISSDAPVEPVNPWESIYAAVTRGLYEGLPLYKYTHDEALTMVDALHAYTMGSSYALFSDDLAGSLEPGKYADFILVDEDPLELSIDEVRRLKVLELAIERDAALFSEPTALSLARQRRNWEIGGGISL